MKEFTLRAVLLGLVMSVVLGAANAYLGLHAGQTIAATYPAAVIGMAFLRAFKGTVLEENIARTAGSIGESVAAGAIFTIPAFVMSGSWTSFDPAHAYWKSTSLMLVGSVLGVLFVSLVRRALVEDPTLPFPESVAAAEIHKAGQRGADAARYLFWSIGFGTLIQALGEFKLYAVGQGLRRAHRTDRQELRPPGPAGQPEYFADRRDLDRLRAHRQPRAGRRRLRDRAGTGLAQFFGQPAGLGLAGAADDVLHGPESAKISAAGRGRRRLGRPGGRRLALHHPAGGGGRHDGGRGLHADPHGQEADRRAWGGRWRKCATARRRWNP